MADLHQDDHVPIATTASGLDLDYARQGDPDGAAVLMIMGLGAQRTWWPDELLGGLAEQGFDVISFDNRDVGLSAGFESAGPVRIETMLAYVGGDRTTTPPYMLADMANDAVELLDALGIDRAHIVGASMGGMISQHIGFSHPDRVLSITSIMSNTGSPTTGQSTPEALQVLLTAAPADREGYIEASVNSARIIGSNTLFDEVRTRERAGAFHDRAYRPTGVSRHLFAVLADGNRTTRLAGITAPTLVIHGTDDTLVQPDGGEATAAAIPGSRLEMIPNMGHDFPAPLIPGLVTLIADHIETAERA